MTVGSLEPSKAPTAEDMGGLAGPFFLSCPYCHWTTLDIGIEFEKHTGITQQLARIKNGGQVVPTLKERERERDKKRDAEARDESTAKGDGSPSDETGPSDIPLHDELFSNLSAFYKSQLTLAMPSNPFSPHHDINFASPSSFSRIMNLYSSASSKKQKRDKPTQMREACSILEGLVPHQPSTDTMAIETLKTKGWDHTLSPSQKSHQFSPTAKFQDEVRPVPTLLRTKRGKRCRTCRHILSKPESKITSTRYKIKLLALNHIPRLSLRALSTPLPLPTAPPSAGAQGFDYAKLAPGIPTHFLLTLSNPLFDPVRVTLATPSTTPGKIATKVTIMCPQFDVGANTDVWDEALSAAGPAKRGGSGTSGGGATDFGASISGAGPVEAGKIWDRGRNWTAVILEVVPGHPRPLAPLDFRLPGTGGQSAVKEEHELELELDDDDDVLEIPVFVRIEFESEVAAEDRAAGGEQARAGAAAAAVGKERREEAFWCVLGVGRIAGRV